MHRRHGMSRFRLAAAVLSAGALLATAACSGPSGTTSSESKTLTIWSFDSKLSESLETILAGYTEEHPDVEFTFVSHPDSDYFRLLTTAWSANEGGPDLALIKAYGVIESFIEPGHLAEVPQDVIEGLEHFADSSIQGVTSVNDGKLYGVPLGMEAGQIYYNTEIFADLGLEVPQSWEDFKLLGEALQDGGVTPIVWPVGDVVHGSLAGEIFGNARRGGTEFESRFVSGEVGLDDEAFVTGLQMTAEMAQFTVDAPTAMSRDEATALFASEAAAMFASGAWNVGTLPDLNADLSFDVFDLPADPSWPVTTAVTPSWSDGGMTVWTKSPHAEMAMDVLAWLSAPGPQSAYTELTGKLPVRDDVDVKDPVLAQIAANVRDHGVNHFVNANLRYGSPSGTDLVGEGLQRILLGEDPVVVASDIDSGIATWFTPKSN